MIMQSVVVMCSGKNVLLYALSLIQKLLLYVFHKDSKDANPGCIRTIISKDPIKLPFGKTDTNVTLLLYDRVEFQLLTNVITKEQRATNIKPKTPDTFQLTKEVRVMVSVPYSLTVFLHLSVKVLNL